MEAWRQGRESVGRKQFPSNGRERGSGPTGWRRTGGAHEALPHTPPGGEPPETPGPLSLGLQIPERKASVKGSQAAPNARALDRCLPFRRFNWDEGKGAIGTRHLGFHLTQADLLMEAAATASGGWRDSGRSGRAKHNGLLRCVAAGCSVTRRPPRFHTDLAESAFLLVVGTVAGMHSLCICSPMSSIASPDRGRGRNGIPCRRCRG